MMKAKENKSYQTAANCENCEFYDYNEDQDCYECRMSLDEDEYIRFAGGYNTECPYFRLYDEYKSVHKQI